VDVPVDVSDSGSHDRVDLLLPAAAKGRFHALDARTGKLCGKAERRSIVNGPMSYEVDGKHAWPSSQDTRS
jgi:hypothetical protein